ncbi:MAG TPA: CopG family transcriptional regulator, partial [Thermoanaerobaculia bacterium]|nr:CopG family transcriptional regulator [Thermoanaerobaculia bacterium]
MKKGTTAETRNVTLALSRSLLRKVKLLAVERDTSISGLLTEFLEEIVKKHDGYERARRRAIRDLR